MRAGTEEKEIWLRFKRASKEYQCNSVQELKTGREGGTNKGRVEQKERQRREKGVQQYMTLPPPTFKAPPMHLSPGASEPSPQKTCTAPSSLSLKDVVQKQPVISSSNQTLIRFCSVIKLSVASSPGRCRSDDTMQRTLSQPRGRYSPQYM